MDQWAFVNVKGYDTRGKLVQDTKQTRKNHPKFFRIGHFEVSKCWDIAVQQMKEGETAVFNCPGDLGYGGNPNQYEVEGAAWIPANSDLTYEMQVTECKAMPDTFKENHGWGAKDGI